MSVIYVKHVSSNHAIHSGYSQLIGANNGAYVPKAKSLLPYALKKWISQRTDQQKGLYDSNSVQKELELAYHLITKNKFRIAHFLNAERDIRLSILAKMITNKKLIATFHKPPEVLKTSIQDHKYLKRLDGAIAVGPNQVDYLKERLQTKKVKFIPHGVDTDFFKPSQAYARNWEQATGLFVGKHLRDFDTLEKVIAILSQKHPDFTLKAVVPDGLPEKLANHPNVLLYQSIDDDALRTLYQTSTFLLLPLIDTTACNSILEALSCGLPVISNDVGGIRGYCNLKNSYLVEKSDASYMAEAAIELMKYSDTNWKMRHEARQSGLKFSWSYVSKVIREFYHQL